MKTSGHTHSWVTFKPCGCWESITSEIPLMADEIAREIKRAVKLGLRVERVTAEEACRITRETAARAREGRQLCGHHGLHGHPAAPGLFEARP